jgi:hypothetical protein
MNIIQLLSGDPVGNVIKLTNNITPFGVLKTLYSLGFYNPASLSGLIPKGCNDFSKFITI